jgi:hypothetical protein
MRRHREDYSIGRPTIAGLGLVVAAFMALSLAVTATGTARFVVGMGYDAIVGYGVGAIFDFAKDLLPIALLALWSRRAVVIGGVLSIAWLCLTGYSCLATHGTVSLAISGIERTGTWKMEVRGNTKTELASVEQQLAALSQPAPPRPVKTVTQALSATRVPNGVWKDSHECAEIQESNYFARACAQVVLLRRELAAAKDYEQLSARADELRNGLAAAPIVATSDPLPAAFSATLGRVLPIDGTEGVALLLTMVVEIISCSGLAGLSALRSSRDQLPPSETPAKNSLTLPDYEGGNGPQASLRATRRTLPIPSLEAVPPGRAAARVSKGSEARNPPSNVVPMRPLASTAILPKGGWPAIQGEAAANLAAVGSHVTTFIVERLQDARGASIAASELRSTYEVWCAARGHTPLSSPKFAAQLKAMGYDKWKSCGLIRYRDLQLVA